MSSKDLGKIFGVVSVILLLVILVFGLWPFHAPLNCVAWLGTESGIRFAHRGIVVSAQSFRAVSPDGPVTLEVWLQPADIVEAGTILAFDDSTDPNDGFAFRQFGRNLAVQFPRVDVNGKLYRAWWSIGHVFDAGAPVLLTLVGSGQTTALYVNGIPAAHSSKFLLSRGDLTGRMILGNSPALDSWSGEIRGLSMEDAALTPVQVAAHAGLWLHGEWPAAPDEPAPEALYGFAERSGNSIRDESATGNALLIPRRYFNPHPRFLVPVWESFRTPWEGGWTWSYWSDVIINVSGFVPLGFFLAGWLSIARPNWHPCLLSICIGCAVSLAIESTQYFLPTRDSSMTDLLTNTLGTALGTALYGSPRIQSWLSKRITSCAPA